MKTGGHIKRCNVGTSEKHNRRDKEYLDALAMKGKPLRYFPDLTHTNRHWGSGDSRYQGKTLADVYQHQQGVYKSKIGRKPMLEDRQRLDKKTGKMKTVAGWSPLREMVVVVKPDTRLQDFEKVKAWFHLHGVATVAVDLHFDEGHIDKQTQERKINNHAHVTLDWMDYETGKTIKLGPEKMRELQDVLADALGMERGEIKENTGAEHIDQADYRTIAQAKENKEIAERNASLKEEKAALEDAIAKKKREQETLNKSSWLDTMKGLANKSEKDKRYLAEIARLEKEAMAVDGNGKPVLYKSGNQASWPRYAEFLRSMIQREKEKVQSAVDAAVAEANKQHQSTMARLNTQISSLKKQLTERNDRIDELEKEVKKAVARAKANAEGLYNLLCRLFPTVVDNAVKAIIERVISRQAKQFTKQQAMAINDAMETAKSVDVRKSYGELFMRKAQETFEEQGTNQAWIDQGAKEVLHIAEDETYINQLREGPGIYKTL